MRIVVGIIAAGMTAGALLAAPASAAPIAEPTASQVTPRKALLTTKEIQKASGTKVKLAPIEYGDLSDPSTCSEFWCGRSYHSDISQPTFYPYDVRVRLNPSAKDSIRGIQRAEEDAELLGAKVVAKTRTEIALWAAENGSLLFYRARGKWMFFIAVTRGFVYGKPARWQEGLTMAKKVEAAQYQKIRKLSGSS